MPGARCRRPCTFAFLARRGTSHGRDLAVQAELRAALEAAGDALPEVPPLGAVLDGAREREPGGERPAELLHAPGVHLVAEAGTEAGSRRGSASAPRARPSSARARGAGPERVPERAQHGERPGVLAGAERGLERARQRRRDRRVVGSGRAGRREDRGDRGDARPRAAPASTPSSAPLGAAAVCVVDEQRRVAQLELETPAVLALLRGAPELERAERGARRLDVHGDRARRELPAVAQHGADRRQRSRARRARARRSAPGASPLRLVDV